MSLVAAFHRWNAFAIKGTVRQHIQAVLKELVTSTTQQTRLQQEAQDARAAQKAAESKVHSAESEAAGALEELQQLVSRQEVVTGQLERAYASNTALATRAAEAERELQHWKVARGVQSSDQKGRADRLALDLEAAQAQKQSVLDALSRRSEEVCL